MKRVLKILNYGLLVLCIGTISTSCEKESTTGLETEQEIEQIEEETNLLSNTTSKTVSLQNVDSGLYVSSENGKNVTCNRTTVGRWETITMVNWADGTVSFRGNNGKYLSDNDGQGRIKFDRAAAGELEKFDVKYDAASGGYSIIRSGKTPQDGYYYLFGETMTFGIDYVREDALFRIIDENSKTVALQNVDSGLYVSSENGDNVTCTRTEVGPWEKITMTTWSDGTVSFKGNNGKYLSDPNDQGRIKFNQDEAGEAEKFDVAYHGDLNGYSIIRANKLPRDGYYYLFGEDMTFGLEYIRDDALFKIIDQ